MTRKGECVLKGCIVIILLSKLALQNVCFTETRFKNCFLALDPALFQF